MAGSIFNDINPATTSGNQLATLLNDFKNAVASGFGGTARPANLAAGGYWVDTTNEGSPNFYWDVKIYTGSTDIAVYRVNLADDTISISGADSIFTISKYSADTVGPILKLLKERIASNGQVNDGDVLGEVQFFGATDTDGNPLVAKLICVADDTMTGSVQGAYIAIEATVAGTASRTEMFRIQDGKVSVGGMAPANAMHVRGATGVKSENRADDAVGALVVARKQRIASSGQVQSGDVLGEYHFHSTDESGAEIEGAKIVATATELHSSTANGTKLNKYVKANGATAYTEVSETTDTLENFKMPTKQVAIQLDKQDVASAASITALSASKAIVNITGATATTLKGIDSAGGTKVIVVHNSSSEKLTVSHEDTGATAADRIKLPKSRNITVLPESSIELFYEAGASRWKVKSGSGSGGGDPVIVTANSQAANSQVTLQDESNQIVLIQSSGGQVDLHTTVFGSTALGTDGSTVTLIGTSDSDSVTINSSVGSKGVKLNSASIELTQYKSLTLKWISALDLYVETARS